VKGNLLCGGSCTAKDHHRPQLVRRAEATSAVEMTGKTHWLIVQRNTAEAPANVPVWIPFSNMSDNRHLIPPANEIS
jgi:hypothetical protein